MISLDFETSGLDFVKDKVIGFSTADKDTAVYYPISAKSLEKLRKLHQDADNIVFHNAPFDIRCLLQLGIEPAWEKYHDTLIMAHLLDEHQVKKLKNLALEIDPEAKDAETELKEWLKTNKKTNYEDVPLELMSTYASRDARYTYDLYYHYLPEITETWSGLYETERKLIKCVVLMEERGVAVDAKFLRGQYSKLMGEAKAIEKKLRKLTKVPKGFNFGSNDDLADLLFNQMKLPIYYTGATGKPAVNKYTLENYPDNEIVEGIQALRSKSHIAATYCQLEVDVLHGHFLQTGTISGRFSSAEPNLQNIPRELGDIRRGFICRPGYQNFYFDYKQIEMVLFAHYSKDALMLEILNSNGDLHRDLAQKLYNKKEVSDDERTVAKRLNFGILYGMGAKRFAMIYGKLLRATYPDEDPLIVAQRFVSSYYQTYPSVRRLRNEIISLIEERGYIKDLFGRYNRVQRDKAYKGLNALIQSCAADLIKEAMVRVQDYLSEHGHGNMLLQIHDELVIEIERGHEDVMVPEIKKRMEDFGEYKFRAPIRVDIKYTDTNWADVRKLPAPL